MSRIGKMPITVPAGVEVTIADGNLVTVKGPKGTLTSKFHHDMIIKQEGAVLTVSRPDEGARAQEPAWPDPHAAAQHDRRRREGLHEGA